MEYAYLFGGICIGIFALGIISSLMPKGKSEDLTWLKTMWAENNSLQREKNHLLERIAVMLERK